MEGEWINPTIKLLSENKPIYRTGLMVNNSLYPKEKVEFVTKDGSKNIAWYMCGPTVYDKSHLGHARTYIGFDVIRRILEDYFGYHVQLCMNITDIDDKIIKKIIDKNVTLHEFTREYENLFFKDMEALNVLYPDRITRVTEYVDEIVKFIQKLIDNKYAYENNGSVYFDINSYTAGGHRYAKLDPTKIGSKEVEAENDGVLGMENGGDKQNKNDFALWKKSKENEPKWNSPWGEGRPGWHIECSAMCTEVFGESLDIHSGGHDLKFPHHDNEIAQTEAFYDSRQWINYFLHTGHLSIEGLKMSKSLKNFLTIEDILNQGYSANSFRLQFLKHKFDSEMDYTEKGLVDSREDDKYFKEFFRNLKRLLTIFNSKQDLKYISVDIKMEELLFKAKNEIHAALCDNFNTKKALEQTFELVSAFYKYEKETVESKTFKFIIGYSFGKYVSYILKCFGLVYDTAFIESFTFKENSSSSEEKIVKPFLDVLVQYRDKIRSLAQNKDFKGIFDESDFLRDEILPTLGVRLKDRVKQDAIWTLEDKDELQKELQLEKKLKQEQEEEKRKKKEFDLLKLNTPAKEWFSVILKDTYAQFDDTGVPTHKFELNTKSGLVEPKELNKEDYNKMKKEFKTHQDKYIKNIEKLSKLAEAPAEKK